METISSATPPSSLSIDERRRRGLRFEICFVFMNLNKMRSHGDYLAPIGIGGLGIIVVPLDECSSGATTSKNIKQRYVIMSSLI